MKITMDVSHRTKIAKTVLIDFKTKFPNSKVIWKLNKQKSPSLEDRLKITMERLNKTKQGSRGMKGKSTAKGKVVNMKEW